MEAHETSGSPDSRTDQGKCRTNPWTWIVAVAALCAIPAIAMACGADFGSDYQLPTTDIAAGEFVSAAQQSLGGSYTHTILEWTAALTAIFACVLCFSYYAMDRDPSVPIIGIALACAGVMDVFHILAADDLINGNISSLALTPFMWTACRLFFGTLMLAGIGLFAFSPTRPERNTIWTTLICCCSVAVAAAVVFACATSTALQQTSFASSIIKRPFDLFPIVPFVICLLFLMPRYYKRYRSYFAFSLFVSMVPQIAAQLYMVFGSTRLFDSSFHIGHGLKILGYAAPFAGIIAESLKTNLRLRSLEFEAHLAQQELFDYNLQLEEARSRGEQQALELAAKAEALDAARRQSDAANRSKSDFLANMSHEIRTPMTAILGFTDLLYGEVAASESPPERIEMVKTIKRNAEFLLGLINDILDLSKIESGKLDIEHVECDTKIFVEDALSLAGPRAIEKGIRLEARTTGTVPEVVRTDPVRVRQILTNLVGNAIKFTDAGTVAIETSFSDEAESGPQLRFTVTDTGIGMTDEQLNRLFQPFTQAESSTTRRFGGTGLGLAISKRLANSLEGDITVKSNYGEGSAFTVTVRADIGENSPSNRNRANRTPGSATTGSRKLSQSTRIEPGCRILLAEDGIDNQRLLSMILTKAGAEVVVVENGELAVGLAMPEGGGEERPFDVILMDMQMPVMDGYIATRTLRDQGYDGPIIALTAHAMDGDRRKCFDAGCDDFASKPVDRQKLFATIANWAGRTSEQARLACEESV